MRSTSGFRALYVLMLLLALLVVGCSGEAAISDDAGSKGTEPVAETAEPIPFDVYIQEAEAVWNGMSAGKRDLAAKQSQGKITGIDYAAELAALYVDSRDEIQGIGDPSTRQSDADAFLAALGAAAVAEEDFSAALDQYLDDPAYGYALTESGALYQLPDGSIMSAQESGMPVEIGLAKLAADKDLVSAATAMGFAVDAMSP